MKQLIIKNHMETTASFFSPSTLEKAHSAFNAKDYYSAFIHYRNIAQNENRSNEERSIAYFWMGCFYCFGEYKDKKKNFVVSPDKQHADRLFEQAKTLGMTNEEIKRRLNRQFLNRPPLARRNTR